MSDNCKWLFDDFDFTQCILKDKPLQKMNYVRYMLARTQSMFKWKNLPDSIPQRELELQIQAFGHVGFIHYDNDLWALRGGFGGPPSPYYMPTKYIIANPALKLFKEYTIDDDVIIVKNDSMYSGLMPMFLRYSTQLVENYLSMMIAIINTRIISLLSAGDDAAYKSAEEYINKIVAGEFGIIGDSPLIDNIRTQPYAQAGSRIITELIEAQQYLKAGWYNDIGLQANYNMKREAINSNEAQMNNDALYPFVDDMLKCRQEGCEKINDLFGTDISVEFDSVWDVKNEEIEQIVKSMEEPEPEPEPEPVTNDEGGEDDEVNEG